MIGDGSWGLGEGRRVWRDMLESLPEVGSESSAGIGVKKCMRCEDARSEACAERA